MPNAPGTAIVPDDPILAEFVFDLTLAEDNVQTVTKTTSPTEKGAPVTDHVVVNAKSFTCTVFITNTPIRRTPDGQQDYLPTTLRAPGHPPRMSPNLLDPSSVILAATNPFALADTGSPGVVFQFEALTQIIPTDRVQTMHDRLTGFLEMRKTCSVYGLRKTWRNMILTSVSAPITVEPQAGVQGCAFTLMFEQLIVVSTNSVAAPQPKEPKGQGASNQGKKDPKKDAEDKKKLVSTLKGIFVSGGDFISGLFGGGAPQP